MRYQSGESLENWAERVRKYEYGYALQQIAKGEDVDIVMEAMSARIVQKLMHPIVSELNNSINTNSSYDPVESKRRYEETMKNRNPASDHMEEKD